MVYSSSKVDATQLRNQCRWQLSRHPRLTTQDWLRQLASSKYAGLELDLYGTGELAELLEQRVASVLEKPAARFMHKGTVAQQVALKIHSDIVGSTQVFIHQQSHMALDECDAVSELAGMDVKKIGQPRRALTLEDVQDAAPKSGILVIELPVRRAGFCLSPWDQLVDLTQWARAQGLIVHFDGARIWESAPYYGKSLGEISALADSVYVSLYKGLGAMAGCVLAGSQAFIDACHDWQSRYGGFLYSAAPYLIGGLDGLDRYLDRMETFHQTACSLAALLEQGAPGSIYPQHPHTNAFQVHFPHTREEIWERCLKMAAEQQVWMFDSIAAGENPGAMGEVQVGEATLEQTPEFWAEKLEQLRYL